jgi:hypothetical protein
MEKRTRCVFREKSHTKFDAGTGKRLTKGLKT